MWFVGIVKLFELLLVAVVVAVVATFKKARFEIGDCRRPDAINLT
jgi:hypothetical protein